VIDAVNSVVGHADKPLPLHAPSFHGHEWDYVKQCIDTGWVSSAGKFVDQFEADLASYTGAAHAVAVVNGTAALHTALVLAGVDQDDEVLLPSLTFVATANAVSYCHATCHFVEVEERTMGIDPAHLEEYLKTTTQMHNGQCINKNTGRRISTLIGMHAFGHPFDLDPTVELCQRYGITLIEDAAESIGSFYKGKHTGTMGRMGILSYNGNKIISTGGGGAILTEDAQLAQEAKHITTTAKIMHRWEYVHDRVAYNYRMPNINAALGCAQLEQLPGLIDSKRILAKRYADAFEHVNGATIFTEPEFATSNYWLNVLMLDNDQHDIRDTLLEALLEAGFLVRPVWRPMHTLKMYRHCPKMPMKVTDSLAQRIINLPSSADLKA
jgi:perosamine synthetase